MARDLHFRLLPALLNPWPRLVRWPARVLAMIRLLLYSDTRPIAGPALEALGRPTTRSARWRFRWELCYQNEIDLLLTVQTKKLTDRWARERVICDGPVPAGGAILIAPHHTNMRLAYLALGRLLSPFGMVLTPAGAQDDWQPGDAASEVMYVQRRALHRQVFGPRIFGPRQGLRQALRLLEAGGYLITVPDSLSPHPGWPPVRILGRELRLGLGPLWLAQRSGKPIVPFMLVPTGRIWRVWCGEPVEATQEMIAGAIEACIRRSPASWPIAWWEDWLRAPVVEKPDRP